MEFKNLMHYLFSVRKKVVDRFGYKFITYELMSGCKELWDTKGDLTLPFNVLYRSNSGDFVKNLIKYKFPIGEPSGDPFVKKGGELFLKAIDKKAGTIVFADEQLTTVSSVNIPAKNLFYSAKKGRGVLAYVINEEIEVESGMFVGDFISDYEGPFELWYLWLNSTWR